MSTTQVKLTVEVDFDVGGVGVARMTGQAFYGAIADPGPLSLPIGDDRGGTASNGKPSLTVGDAGGQITRTGLNWGAPGVLGQPATVTFAFRSTAPVTMPTDTVGFTRFTDLQIAATLLALQSWSDTANITFQRISGTGLDDAGYSNGATILFGNFASGQAGSAAFAYLPGNAAVGSASGDVWVNSSLGYNANPVLLGYGQQVLLHELGHAIGLSHPAAYNAAEGVNITYSANATYFEDSRQYTVMSYFSESSTGGSFGARYASAPLLDDIAAIQRLYGANMATRTGDTVYGFNSNADRPWYTAANATSSLIFAVWDAGGNDTFDFSGYSQSQVIDLRQGAFSNVGGLIGNVSIAVGAVIENVIGGSGADTIMGNAANNRIAAGLGANLVDGGGGVDTLVFSGARSDYTITWIGQSVTVERLNERTIASNIEFLQFSDQTIAATPTGAVTLQGDNTNEVMTGSAFNDSLSGNGGDDVLNGLGGRDWLNGGAGNDILNGGDGDDTLIGGPGDDRLDGGAGYDIALYSGARAGVVVNLATGLASGGDGNDVLISIEEVLGSVYDDVLIGDAGDNVLRGGGGVDVLIGGAGNDRLFAGPPSLAGGAPDIIKTAAVVNSAIATAVSLDNGFDLLTRTTIIESATIPHATVVASGHGGVEYYAFTVTAGAAVTFDIDGAAFDSVLRLYDAGGRQLAENDDGGSDGFNDSDSQLTYTFDAAGTYYLQVAAWATNVGASFTTKGIAVGAGYTLNVSIPNHAVASLVMLGSTLDGGGGNDTLMGSAGADRFIGGSGSDLIYDNWDGDGDGDTLVLDRAASSYFFLQDGQGWKIFDGLSDVDGVYGVEQVEFAGAAAMSIGAGAALGFDAYRYMAGYADLRAAFGASPGDAYRHYISNGAGEGRTTTAFDALRYIASSPDLIRAFGVNERAAAQHYVVAGENEGRSVTGFNALTYAASNLDLARAFGADTVAATRHYIQSGLAEERAITGFDGLLYAASYRDLAFAFGVNADAATHHYLVAGLIEGRATTFSARDYAASSWDLAVAFGADGTLAVQHYLTAGIYEGRVTTGFDAVAYLLSNGDLAGRTVQQAVDHWLSNGAAEGRSGDALFGREQVSHVLTGAGVNSMVDTVGDHDWFQLNTTPGQTYRLDLAGVGGGLADGEISVYDSLGRLIGAGANAGPGGDARLTFTATGGGAYYVVITGVGAATGAYHINVTGGAAASQAFFGDEGAQVLPVLAEPVIKGCAGPQVSPLADRPHFADEAFIDFGALQNEAFVPQVLPMPSEVFTVDRGALMGVHFEQMAMLHDAQLDQPDVAFWSALWIKSADGHLLWGG